MLEYLPKSLILLINPKSIWLFLIPFKISSVFWLSILNFTLELLLKNPLIKKGIKIAPIQAVEDIEIIVSLLFFISFNLSLPFSTSLKAPLAYFKKTSPYSVILIFLPSLWKSLTSSSSSNLDIALLSAGWVTDNISDAVVKFFVSAIILKYSSCCKFIFISFYIKNQ